MIFFHWLKQTDICFHEFFFNTGWSMNEKGKEERGWPYGSNAYACASAVFHIGGVKKSGFKKRKENFTKLWMGTEFYFTMLKRSFRLWSKKWDPASGENSKGVGK